MSNIYDVSKINVKIQKRHGFSDIDTVEHSLSISVQQLKLHHSKTTLAQELISKHTFNHGDDLGVTLVDVLTNEQSFDVFVRHLSLEYSLECLLSLIEFIQFQQMIDEYINGSQLECRREPRERSISHNSMTSSTGTHSHSVGNIPGRHSVNVNASGGGIIRFDSK